MEELVDLRGLRTVEVGRWSVVEDDFLASVEELSA